MADLRGKRQISFEIILFPC